jgi:hypothetical protein
MGREEAYRIIQKHSLSSPPNRLLESLATDKDFPFSHEQLRELIKEPGEFASRAVLQCEEVIKNIAKILPINGIEISDFAIR